MPVSMRLPVWLAAAVVIVLSGIEVRVPLLADDPTARRDAIAFFERRVRPVLAEHCYECHGTHKQESDLRVDHISFLRSDGAYGRILVPGKPDQSMLYVSLTHRDEDLKMPDGRAKLSARNIADIKRWIEAGALWPDEPVPKAPAPKFDLQARKRRLPWIWQTPIRQTVPPVRNAKWPRGDEDRFVLAKLEEQGLVPAADTEPEIWLRRVYFALIGLPPTPDQIQAFLARPTAAAKERVVDQLLRSPHFGERWARHWMDLVRYAESRGHESDFIIANAWHYRDYLIRAFNADVPFNQFVLEHLAGDLLPRPRLNPDTGANESVLATAWPFFGEEVHSPVDIRQDECDRIDNKIDVLSKTFLGLTVACARCHDHKFDAISQADYYALAGFVLSSDFRQVRFETMEHNRRVARQLCELEEQTQRRLARALADDYQSVVSQSAAYLAAARPAIDAHHAASGSDAISEATAEAWRRELTAARRQPDHPLHQAWQTLAKGDSVPTTRSTTTDSAKRTKSVISLAAAPDSRVIVDFSASASQPWLTNGCAFGLGPVLPGDFRLPTSSEDALDGVFTYGAARKDPIWNCLRLAKDNQDDSGKLAATRRAGGAVCTPTFTLKSGQVHYLVRGDAQVYAAVDSHLMIEGPLHGRLMKNIKAPDLQWVAHDLTPYQGHRLHVEFGALPGKPFELLQVVDGPLKANVPARGGKIGGGQEGASGENVPARMQHTLEAALLCLRARAAGRHEARREMVSLLDWMVRRPELFTLSPDEHRSKIRRLLDEYSRRRAELAAEIATTSHTAVAWMDGTGVDEHVLIRGKYQRPGSVARRSLPAAFPGAGPIAASGSGRLQLARQLVDPANPLVARVIVNRVWHHLFGRGIVATVDNFGWLGRRPTHPRLMDHLAHRFVHEDQWSLKRLIKRLVLSRTYGMTSRPDDSEAERADPKNMLLHRMPVRRLEAEVIRDAMLTVSGRLDASLFGPPIPVHLTDFVIGRGRPAESGPLDGAGRRSIYTSVRRNFLPTLMLTFDVPIPFSTVGRRNVTNVPAQSLALMNDMFVYEQAGVWANRIQGELPGRSTEDRIARLYWEAFGREATRDELAACSRAVQDFARSRGEQDDDPRVWHDLCHTLFRVNEFTYVR